MPIYEYCCRHCDSRFEEIVLPSETAVACPKCAGKDVERQLSVFNSPGDREAQAAPGGSCSCTPQTCRCH